MKILISNDDGFQSQGIELLARVASQFADVRVLAPDRDRSAVSNSLTLDRPISIKQAGNGFYYANGTPTDCVHVAGHFFPDFQPDWVFTGINHGANMGDDTLYSGTVAAATEGHLLGIPAVAFSLADKSNTYWATAEKVLPPLIKFILSQKMTKPILWNVNIPKVQPEEVKGIKVVRLGRRHHGQGVVKASNPHGDPVYWIGVIGEAMQLGEDTDFYATSQGYVTITPLSVDLTDNQDLPQMIELFNNWQF